MRFLLLMMVLTIIAVTLPGCGKLDRLYAAYTGQASESCVDGVVYLQFTSGASVKYEYNDLGYAMPAKCK